MKKLRHRSHPSRLWFCIPAIILAIIVAPLAASAPFDQEAAKASVAEAEPGPDPRIDPATGRERAVYPPPRHFEHLHMRLEIDIPNMNEPRFRARQVLTLAATGSPRQELILDAALPPVLTVSSVSLAAPAPAPVRPLRFEQAERSAAPDSPRHHGTTGLLRIKFSEPVPPGRRIDVVIEYECRYPDATGNGLTWSAADPEGLSETDRFAQIHSQGQPQHNHTWFPCHDFPNERLSTELIVTVEDPYLVASNGRLFSSRLGPPGADGRTRTTWHWLQERPHVNYLVSLVVGRFSVVALPPASPEHAPINMDGRPVSTYLLAPVGSEVTARAAFARTPDMITFYGELFGHPYPWEKYSQALVRHFVWGGMENTSATTLREEYARSKPGEEDDLIAHEVAHQWFGNLITTKSWEHLWLNEGWASFAEALWAEHAAGDDPAARRRAYQAKIAEYLSAQRLTNRTYAPLFAPMASRRYSDIEEVFLKPNDVYAKGAVVLHMLRQKLGDETFFAGTRLYVQRFAFQQVETDDFRRVMEEVSGLSLERFFEQWCYQPGLPRINVAYDWADAESPDEDHAGDLTITIDQVQRLDHDNPAYAFILPVHIQSAGSPRQTYIRYIEVDSRTTEAIIPLPRRAARIDLDPDMTVAAFTQVRRQLPRPE